MVDPRIQTLRSAIDAVDQEADHHKKTLHVGSLNLQLLLTMHDIEASEEILTGEIISSLRGIASAVIAKALTLGSDVAFADTTHTFRALLFASDGSIMYSEKISEEDIGTIALLMCYHLLSQEYHAYEVLRDTCRKTTDSCPHFSSLFETNKDIATSITLHQAMCSGSTQGFLELLEKSESQGEITPFSLLQSSMIGPGRAMIASGLEASYDSLPIANILTKMHLNDQSALDEYLQTRADVRREHLEDLALPAGDATVMDIDSEKPALMATLERADILRADKDTSDIVDWKIDMETGNVHFHRPDASARKESKPERELEHLRSLRALFRFGEYIEAAF